MHSSPQNHHTPRKIKILQIALLNYELTSINFLFLSNGKLNQTLEQLYVESM